jgi:hypothetical protein
MVLEIFNVLRVCDGTACSDTISRIQTVQSIHSISITLMHIRHIQPNHKRQKHNHT